MIIIDIKSEKQLRSLQKRKEGFSWWRRAADTVWVRSKNDSLNPLTPAAWEFICLVPQENKTEVAIALLHMNPLDKKYEQEGDCRYAFHAENDAESNESHLAKQAMRDAEASHPTWILPQSQAMVYVVTAMAESGLCRTFKWALAPLPLPANTNAPRSVQNRNSGIEYRKRLKEVDVTNTSAVDLAKMLFQYRNAKRDILANHGGYEHIGMLRAWSKSIRLIAESQN